jgi:hypothetical protein
LRSSLLDYNLSKKKPFLSILGRIPVSAAVVLALSQINLSYGRIVFLF